MPTALRPVGIAQRTPMPPAEPIGRDRFAGASRERLQGGARERRSRPSRSTSTPPPIRSCAPRSIATSCRSPPRCAIEEMINYFPYAYPAPAIGERAVPHHGRGVSEPVVRGPQDRSRSASRAMRCSPRARPRANLVFLIDTSGSMDAPNRLPLVKQSLAMLLDAARAERPRGDRHLCGQRRHRARADPAASEKAKILGVHRAARGRAAAPPAPRASGRPMRSPSGTSTRTASTA